MSDPTIDAARDVLAEILDKIRRGIEDLTVDQGFENANDSTMSVPVAKSSSRERSRGPSSMSTMRMSSPASRTYHRIALPGNMARWYAPHSASWTTNGTAGAPSLKKHVRFQAGSISRS